MGIQGVGETSFIEEKPSKIAYGLFWGSIFDWGQISFALFSPFLEISKVKILKEEGFTDIVKLGTTFPVDFVALKDNIKCFIEVRGRSYDAKTQFFYFRPSKIDHMIEANNIFPVYVLLINKWGPRLMLLKDMLSGKDS